MRLEITDRQRRVLRDVQDGEREVAWGDFGPLARKRLVFAPRGAALRALRGDGSNKVRGVQLTKRGRTVLALRPAEIRKRYVFEVAS